jgi:hypothetical protein
MATSFPRDVAALVLVTTGCIQSAPDTVSETAGAVAHSPAELVPFVTDGCSMFPDGTLGDPTRWQHCCIAHDFAYYRGGTRQARKAADRALELCVASTCSDALGVVMYRGARVSGTPALPTPFRWGYGWKYDPFDGYREDTPAMHAAVDQQLLAYQLAPIPPHALEQRLLELLDMIDLVPGLESAMEEVSEVLLLCD